MLKTALSLIVIRAADIKTSLAFYHALGALFVEEQHVTGPVHYSWESGGVVLELYPEKAGASQEPCGHTTMLGFDVASLDVCLEDLRSLGIVPKSPPRESKWGRWVTVVDPSGRSVRITQGAEAEA